ncbi:hypothetical protein F511_45341 [Dorcoceras hygrometricum]|uniref:Uncharacterized protein n=1 Tax=Dorcoceras hygrometricum TaxID=472368 RepID=A0A2Z7A3G0_9LAMI|nr:hypothetical protein F511_45341 [Dorcoceras hygrometricum]
MATGREGCALAADAGRPLPLLGARLSRVTAHDGRFLRVVVAHDVACWLRALPPRFFVGGGAAVGRPPLRRVSGDVVTAGLNSFRV